MKIILGILMLCIIVIAHELGHMLIAKLNHIEVNEFWIGFGPKIWGFEKGGTKYSLRAIPLGGACVFEDVDAVREDSDEEENESETTESETVESETIESVDAESVVTDAKDGVSKVKYDKKGRPLVKLMEANVWARIATLFAGSFFNFALAFILGIVIMIFAYVPSTKVVDVTPDSPAAKAGMCAGDTIIKMNGSRVYLYPEISLAVQAGYGKPLSVVYEHENKRYKAEMIPEMNEEYGYYMIGVSFGGDGAESKNVLDIAKGSLQYVRYMIKMTFASIKMLTTGQASVNEMSGPVGVVSIVSENYDEAAKVSPIAVMVSMFNIAVLISANLGVINLLPFPALDGGRLVFAFYEAITKKKVDAKVEGVVHFIGSVLLLLLMAYIMFNDFLRLFTR